MGVALHRIAQWPIEERCIGVGSARVIEFANTPFQEALYGAQGS